MRIHVAVICVLITCLLNIVSASAELYQRSPDVMPGTIPEMQDPAWWIARMDNPDGVILKPAEIRVRNEAYLEKMSRANFYAGVHPGRVPMDWQLNRWPGRFVTRPDIGSLTDTELAAFVRTQVTVLADYIKAEPYGNYLGTEYAPEELDAFIIEAAIENISVPITIWNGITVRSTQLRVIPALFPGVVGIKNIDTTNYTIDLWTAAMVGIGRQVTVLHRSRSGSHLFVMAENNFGWIRAEDVAFGSSDEIDAFTESPDFLLCTGNRVPYFTDETCKIVSGWFSMADRIHPAPGGNSRKILVPVRNVNGTFDTASAWLSPDADIHKGNMPYTRRNIVTLAFKLLGDPYDWTGAVLGRNHETTYRDIFACFGFALPHNGGLFTHFGDKDIAAMPEMGKEAEYKLILDNEPFVSIAVSRGHAMLFLGEYNGEPIIFDQNGYSYTMDDGSVMHVKRCSIITPVVVPYLLKYPITFLELK